MAYSYCKTCDTVTEGQSRGIQFQCKACGKWTKKSEKRDGDFKFDGNDYAAVYTVTSDHRVLTKEEIVKKYKIDLTIWNIDRIVYGGSEGYRKDRKVEWEVEDGHVLRGSVSDSGKMVIVTLHSFRIYVSRKTEEIRDRLVVDEFVAQAKKFAPKYQKIKYRKQKDGCLFELAIPDLQLGRLVAAEDAGFDITPENQIRKADEVVDRLVGYSRGFNVAKILFPVGNDFFDTNSAMMATVHGTPQQDDVLWKRTYKLGCSFIVRTIDKLMNIAPVDVLIIPGNHDEDKIFHLGEYMEAWYHKNPNVDIDNRPMKRKYYPFGRNLIGLTHGYYEKNGKLDSLMAYEVPQLWAGSNHREWHLGDLHHKVDLITKTDEFENGVVVRILRSLATPSVWEFDKGLVGSQKAGEAFVWSNEKGVIAQFTA